MVLSGFGIWKASSFLFEEATVSESKEKTEKIVNKPLNKIENWKHPDFFEFKNFKEFRLTDTLHIDLNGNGILEKVYASETTSQPAPLQKTQKRHAPNNERTKKKENKNKFL